MSLTNCIWQFWNSCVIETGLSNFHKLTVSIMNQISRDYNQKSQLVEILGRFLMIHLENIYCLNCCLNGRMEKISKSSNGPKKFLNIRVSALDNFALIKKKYSWGKSIPFLNQTLKKVKWKEIVLEIHN